MTLGMRRDADVPVDPLADEGHQLGRRVEGLVCCDLASCGRSPRRARMFSMPSLR